MSTSQERGLYHPVPDKERQEDIDKIKVEKCKCGNKITPLAKTLQNTTSALERKCVSCLIREGKVEVMRR